MSITKRLHDKLIIQQQREWAKAERHRLQQGEIEAVQKGYRDGTTTKDEGQSRLAAVGIEIVPYRSPLSPKQQAIIDEKAQAVTAAFHKAQRHEPLTNDEHQLLSRYAKRGYERYEGHWLFSPEKFQRIVEAANEAQRRLRAKDPAKALRQAKIMQNYRSLHYAQDPAQSISGNQEMAR